MVTFSYHNYTLWNFFSLSLSFFAENLPPSTSSGRDIARLSKRLSKLSVYY